MTFRYRASIAPVLVAAAIATGCGASANLPLSAGIGPDPELPVPDPPIIPTINVAEATGWPEGRTPVAADGLAVRAFATGLQHPRWIHVLPNGDVLVAESAAPPKPPNVENGGIVGWLTREMMLKAGAAVPSANRITLLRDADKDGVAETRTVFLDSLRSPFGMALIENRLYVANADGIVRVPYVRGVTAIVARPASVVELPSGRNHHWTKNIIASRDGTRLYAAVGSNSNIAEHGLNEEQGRAAIWEIDLDTGGHRVFANGLRNPVGLAWEPTTGVLWAVVNERDGLGSDLVPDYLTSVSDGAFYGWPWSYFGSHVDPRVEPERPDLVARAVRPDYGLGSHVAPLGLAASAGTVLPPTFQNGMFIGLHGSWNREPFSGYKVIFVPFAGGKPRGMPIDVLTGFLEGDVAYGRPVGVAMARDGSLLVADDVGNAIWRVSASR